MGLDADDRRRGLIEYLSLRGYATMHDLAMEFSVSIKTIQRDITHLMPYYPITTCCGRYGGGVYIQQNYKPYLIYLTPKQQEAIETAIATATPENSQTLREILNLFARR